MINRDGFTLNLRELFWEECCSMDTQLDNILVKINIVIMNYYIRENLKFGENSMALVKYVFVLTYQLCHLKLKTKVNFL